jgi:hypothetical protein
MRAIRARTAAIAKARSMASAAAVSSIASVWRPAALRSDTRPPVSSIHTVPRTVASTVSTPVVRP